MSGFEVLFSSNPFIINKFMTDQLLISRIKAGDERAARQLVDQNQKMVLRTVSWIINDVSCAEDVSQEVFIQFFKNINSFRGDASISTLLYRIAINLSLNKKRGVRKWFQGAVDLLSIKPEIHMVDSLNEAIERKDKSIVLKWALDKLPENQRLAFVLTKSEGLTQKEAALIMKTSPKAIESLIQRAKVSLRSYLADYYTN